jgi:hypothetical protein
VALHKDVWWLLGSAIAAVAAAPLLVRGDAQTTARRTAAVQKIEQLSPAERQHLEENFKRYEKLTPADQARYREVHQRLQDNPAVAEALVAFSQWWPTVSAREQSQLFKASEVKERVALVSQIQEELDKDRSQRVFLGSRWGRDGQRSDSNLSAASFYEIMEALEGLASETYRLEKELPEIQKLDPKSPQRYLKLITALQQKQQTWSTIVPNASAENRIIEAVSDEKTREMVKSRLSDRFFGNRGFRFRSQLVMTLATQLYLEGLRQSFGEEDLRRKLDSLDDEEKSELYAYRGEDARFQLRARVFKDMREAFNPVPEFFQVPGGMRSGGGRGGDGPGRDGPGRDGQSRGEGPGRDGPGRPDGPMRPN